MLGFYMKVKHHTQVSYSSRCHMLGFRVYVELFVTGLVLFWPLKHSYHKTWKGCLWCSISRRGRHPCRFWRCRPISTRTKMQVFMNVIAPCAPMCKLYFELSIMQFHQVWSLLGHVGIGHVGTPASHPPLPFGDPWRPVLTLGSL